jgi:hypothetical protein
MEEPKDEVAQKSPLAAAILLWVQQQLGTHDLDEKELGAVNTLIKNSKTLEDAQERGQFTLDGLKDRRKWDLSKAQKTREQLEKGPNGLEKWYEGQAAKTAFLPCVEMNQHAVANKGDSKHIVFTAGAADCIAVATNQNGVAWVHHADATSTKTEMNGPRNIEFEVKKRIGSQGTVYLSSNLIKADFAQDIVDHLTALKFTVISNAEGRIACDANTELVTSKFNPMALVRDLK